MADGDAMNDEARVRFVEPPCRWPGGKRNLVPTLLKYLPERFGNYHEPFVGAGALYWTLASSGRLDGRIARLSDRNGSLMAMYRALQDNVEDVIAMLCTRPPTQDFYMRYRKQRPDDDLGRAVWFLFVQRFGFSGLYRVNKKGEQNVPWGKRDGMDACDDRYAEVLRSCARVLRTVRTELVQSDFEVELETVRAGDLVYLDPPYVQIVKDVTDKKGRSKKNKAFNAYDESGFELSDHERLRDCARVLKRRSVHVLISNSDTSLTRELYADPIFRIESVVNHRSIQARGDERGAVNELLIR